MSIWRDNVVCSPYLGLMTSATMSFWSGLQHKPCIFSCGDGLNSNPKVVGNHHNTHATITLVGICMKFPNPRLRKHHGRGCGENVRAGGWGVVLGNAVLQTRLSHSWTHSSYGDLQKTWTRSSWQDQPAFQQTAFQQPSLTGLSKLPVEMFLKGRHEGGRGHVTGDWGRGKRE